VLPADLSVAERAVALRQQRKMTLGDAIIAATALVHNLPLLTRNVDDFKNITGLRIENPLGPAYSG
jgi:predicted nucleic acid-binding protein